MTTAFAHDFCWAGTEPALAGTCSEALQMRGRPVACGLNASRQRPAATAATAQHGDAVAQRRDRWRSGHAAAQATSRDRTAPLSAHDD